MACIFSSNRQRRCQARDRYRNPWVSALPEDGPSMWQGNSPPYGSFDRVGSLLVDTSPSHALTAAHSTQLPQSSPQTRPPSKMVPYVLTITRSPSGSLRDLNYCHIRPVGVPPHSRTATELEPRCTGHRITMPTPSVPELAPLSKPLQMLLRPAHAQYPPAELRLALGF